MIDPAAQQTDALTPPHANTPFRAMRLYLSSLAPLTEAQTSDAPLGCGWLLFASLLGFIVIKAQQERSLIKAAQTWRDRKSQLRLQSATLAEWEAWRTEGQDLLAKLRKIEHRNTSYRNEMNNVEADLRLYEASTAGYGKP